MVKGRIQVGAKREAAPSDFQKRKQNRGGKGERRIKMEKRGKRGKISKKKSFKA